MRTRDSQTSERLQEVFVMKGKERTPRRSHGPRFGWTRQRARFHRLAQFITAPTPTESKILSRASLSATLPPKPHERIFCTTAPRQRKKKHPINLKKARFAVVLQ